MRHRWARPRATLPPLLLAAALAGCGGNVRETFGLNRPAPDEFQVVRRAPLIVPPDARLRPPQPGAEGPVASTPAGGALEALTGQPPPAAGRAASPAERLLVEQAPVRPIPNIRQVIASEDSQVAVLDRGTFLFILSWQRRGEQSSQTAADVLDPVAESRRLRGDGVVQTARTASVPILR